MLNQDDFINRLHKVFEYYNLTAATFADEIKVQRSSISHLLSGRNKPSLEFVLKMINAYEELTLDWLLYGKGSFPKEETPKPTPVVAKEANGTSKAQGNLFSTTPIDPKPEENPQVQALEEVSNDPKKITTPSGIERIVIFYKDGTFKEYINP